MRIELALRLRNGPSLSLSVPIFKAPNYLGDLISFSGLCLVSGRWVTIVIPSIMLARFVFANILMLNSHLRDHYGAAFDEYAARTSKLIPFVY